ncbi:MAG: DUF4874 domain-containing protein [Kiritimatiellae bacterium]|nr:DUF4874 domain-containing protein [Kiritimatiellia bacterium]
MKKTTIMLAAVALCAAAGAVEFRGIRPGDPDGRAGLRNPERGWRFEIGVGKLAEDPCKFTHVGDHWPFARFKGDGVTVAQAYCYLTQFHDKPVSDEKIAALEADFARARKDGVKFLLRFAYDHDPGLKPTPSLDRLLAHVEQLKPVVRRNADVIYCLQIGWVGAWGEFHSSAIGLEKDPKAVAAVVGATLDMLPANRSTMMRRVDYKINALKAMGADTNEVTAATAWTAAPTARIGFFNDGTLANWWDGATFVDEPYADDSNREFERVKREGLYTPVDGELFWSGQGEAHTCFACGIRAIDRFAKHHYTTFSLVHGHSQLDMSDKLWTIDGWKVTPVTSAELGFFGVQHDPDYFAGVPHRTAYEFIRDHLGYRIALRSCDVRTAGETATLALRFRNWGFSAPVNPRAPVVVIVGADGSCREFPVAFDCRRLLPGKDVEVAATAPKCAVGERFALWLPDEEKSVRMRPEYAIRLASRMETRVVGGRLLHFLDAPPAEPQDDGWKLVWHDEFDGDKLDETKWSRIPGNKDGKVSDWNRHTSTRPDLVEVKDGVLALVGVANADTNADPRACLQGQIWSRGKYAFLRGKIEIRAKFDNQQGAWPAFWMLPEKGKWPDGGEIDIIERLNGDNFVYQTCHSAWTHTMKRGREPRQGGKAVITPDAWNVYGLEWYDDALVWTVNGVETFRYPRTDADPLQWPFTTPYYVLLDQQLGGNWVGEVDLKTLPARTYVDYVRVYEKK